MTTIKYLVGRYKQVIKSRLLYKCYEGMSYFIMRNQLFEFFFEFLNFFIKNIKKIMI
jgi:hypothetical protein